VCPKSSFPILTLIKEKRRVSSSASVRKRDEFSGGRKRKESLTYMAAVKKGGTVLYVRHGGLRRAK